MIKWKITPTNGFTLLEFELDGPITPDVLRELQFPKLVGRKGVVLSGRGPIWLYGALIHHYHPHPWIGVFDPRLAGAVVVQSHTPKVEVGDVIEVYASEEEVE